MSGSSSEHTADALELLRRVCAHAAAWPQKLAYSDSAGVTLTYAQLLGRTAALAEVLRGRLPPGCVVLICCPNSCDFPVAFLAALAAGGAALLVSTESPAAEVLAAAETARAAAILASPQMVQAVGGSGRVCIPLPLGHFQTPHFQTVDLPASADRLLLMSSGSTGRPKIICRSGAAVDAVCDQMCRSVGICESDVVLATVPLCHSYGIEHGLLAPLWAGASVHLCRGLELPRVLPLLTAGVTVLPGVPSMFEALVQHVQRPAEIRGLRAAYSAGAPLPANVSDAFFDRFGVRIGQLYGASEVGSVLYADPRRSGFDAGGVGWPMPGVKVVVAQEHPAHPLPPRQQGQVWISAPSMFSGYLGEEAGQGGVVDGFFPTGDLGQLDENGSLTITGRLKLLIDVGGLKVNPLEVEAVLQQHPAVAACVVVPVRQSATVVRLKAIVTARESTHPPGSEELRRFARARLASYKVPRLFELRDQLPRTATGKVLRHLVSA